MARTKDQKECLAAYEAYDPRYNIKEHVPDAVWDFTYFKPAKPKNYRKIANYGLPKEKRKFPYYSDDFIAKMEHLARTDSESQEYISFVEEEWKRRLNGFFFYNGDKLEWVTGRHYCRLQYWKIPATREVRGVKRKGRYQPDFIDAQRDVHYFFDHARKDEYCAGLCYVGFRRSGKSDIAISEGYWDTTEHEESVFYLQSKNEDDAKKLFKKIVDSWKKIPIWFKPIDTGSTTQANILYFGEKKKSASVEDRVYRNVLNSVIEPKNSKEEALDGEYASYVVHDECGKASRTLDVAERWNISRECLFDGADIIGFGVCTSTVEDSDKYGSEYFKSMYEKSDPNKRLPNGLTETYLYRLFLPAYYGFRGTDKNENISFVDEWGYTNIDASRNYHRKYQKALKGQALLSRKRKYPLNIDDCWVTNEGKNNFDISKLIEQKIWNAKFESPDYVRGNFTWKGGVRWSEVVFYPDPNGRWMVGWMPPEKDRNRFEFYNGTQRKPTRSYCFTGIDPFSHDVVVDEGQGSNGAAVTILKSYPGEEMKESVVCVYDYRQADTRKQAEDMIMQCVFYSSPALIENNVPVVINSFKDNGYLGYCEYNPIADEVKNRDNRKKGLLGYPTKSIQSVEDLISHVDVWIRDTLGAQEDGTHAFCPYDELLDQLKDFNPSKRGPYDMVMALGMAVILTRNEQKSVQIEWDFDDWLPKADPTVYRRMMAVNQEA